VRELAVGGLGRLGLGLVRWVLGLGWGFGHAGPRSGAVSLGCTHLAQDDISRFR